MILKIVTVDGYRVTNSEIYNPLKFGAFNSDYGFLNNGDSCQIKYKPYVLYYADTTEFLRKLF